MAESEIEAALAHQEQQIQDLSEIVIEQGKDIEKLKAYIEKLEGKIEELEDGADAPAANVKPPHY